MKKIFYILTLFLVLTSCGDMTSDRKSVCNCCDKTYTNIDGALNCIMQTPDNRDGRLLLFAFVKKEVKANQELGCNILKDEDIINAAKQKYLLITLDPNNINIPKDQNVSELLAKIKENKSELFFIVTNQAFYPFHWWTADENKESVISDLSLGDGP